MIAARQVLEAYIARDPFFQATFSPYTADSDEPGHHADVLPLHGKPGVGPMAAVAGAIAWAGIEAMQESGAVFGVIDNGGDIALISQPDR